MFLAILAIVICIYWLYIIGRNENLRQIALIKKRHQEYIQEEGIIISNEYSYESNTSYTYAHFFVDESRRTIYISEGKAPIEKIPFSELLGSESAVTEDHDFIIRYSIKINRRNIQHPLVEILLISARTEKSSLTYREVCDFADSVNATIKAIVSHSYHPIIAPNIIINNNYRKDVRVSSIRQELQTAHSSDYGVRAQNNLISLTPAWCLYCRSRIDQNSKKCPSCKKSLSDSTKVVKCNFCQKYILKSDSACKYCGCPQNSS